jgi:hypothetical protein
MLPVVHGTHGDPMDWAPMPGCQPSAGTIYHVRCATEDLEQAATVLAHVFPDWNPNEELNLGEG